MSKIEKIKNKILSEVNVFGFLRCKLSHSTIRDLITIVKHFLEYLVQ